MSNKDLTEVVVILDRSGSMERIRFDAIGGFNMFIEAQRSKDIAGTANVTLVQFDHEYEVNYISKPVEEVSFLDKSSYVPRGSTALMDAIGRAVLDVESKVDSQADTEAPGQVIVAILTDGKENCSQEFTKDRILSLISTKEKEGWEFIYLSADPNAMNDATSFGIKGGNVFLYETTPSGCVSSYTDLNSSVMNYRNTGNISGEVKVAGKDDI